jgi:hypothetical protein
MTLQTKSKSRAKPSEVGGLILTLAVTAASKVGAPGKSKNENKINYPTQAKRRLEWGTHPPPKEGGRVGHPMLFPDEPKAAWLEARQFSFSSAS